MYIVNFTRALLFCKKISTEKVYAHLLWQYLIKVTCWNKHERIVALFTVKSFSVGNLLKAVLMAKRKGQRVKNKQILFHKTYSKYQIMDEMKM